MTKRALRWFVAAAIVLLAMGTGGLQAGQPWVDLSQKPTNEMTAAMIQRSHQIEAQLAAIEANKEAFVDQLIASWAAVLNPEIYNVESEIKPLAMAAIPWQLYGASLVGDWNTMIMLLTNKVGAGTYINVLSEPQPRIPVDPKALGSYTDSLVFTPIPPCRMVDTRNTGARTGILQPFVARTFDLTTDGYAEGQGGVTSGCTGLPSYSHYGWSVNITAAGFTAIGGLTVYGYGGTAPTASAINYSPGQYAIANQSTLIGCDGCMDDVTMYAFGGATHVILDVMGYFQRATGFGKGVVTYLAGTTTSVANGGYALLSGATCPAGTNLVGGGMSANVDLVLTSDHISAGTYWYEYVYNISGGAANVTVYSACETVV
jgi:hypothetical protein